MKPENIIIFIMPILLGITLLGLSYSQKTVAYNTVNREYGIYVSSAAYDAAGMITLSGDGNAFSSQSEREKVKNEFFKSLSSSLYAAEEPNKIKVRQHTPFLILMDTDGFYISYPKEDASSIRIVETGLIPYTAGGSGVSITYTLGDTIRVFTGDSYYEGEAEELNKTLHLFANKAEYTMHKNSAIVCAIEKEINDLLKTENLSTLGGYKGFSITLPQDILTQSGRLLKTPSVAAFVLGKSNNTTPNKLIVYAFAGGELTKPLTYFADGSLYYDENKGGVFGSMKELSRRFKPHISAYSAND